MRILLIGEYNSSHRFLKEGLQQLGHEAIVVGLNDGFKKVPVDLKIHQRFHTGLRKKLKVALYKLFNIDLHSIDVFKQIKQNKELLQGYDIVQYINESPFLCQPKYEIKIFDLIKKWNKNIFLLSCGTDYISVNYAHQKKFRYSILTPYLKGQLSEKEMEAALKYISKPFKKLHEHLYKNIKGVIASDLDYHIPLENNPKYLGMVPNPIKLSEFNFSPLEINNKIVIFHGINKNNYIKKGNNLFDQALDIIQEKYPHKVDVIKVTNLPYKEYIKSFDKAHILLDQIYAHDQGFNALEAMAKGKVVFTGAEQEWLDYYTLEKDSVAINALPNVEELVAKLEWLILNPTKILEISKNARTFIEQEHEYIKATKEYFYKWTSQL